MNPITRTLGLLAVGVLSFALVACDGVFADVDDDTPDRPVTGTPGQPGTAVPGQPGPGDIMPRPDDDVRLELAPIDSLDIVVRESYPPQYVAVIGSGLPSGCAKFHAIEMMGHERTFEITVWNTMPADQNVACTMIYGMLEHSVELGSDLESGQVYTVIVNGETKTTFTAQ